MNKRTTIVFLYLALFSVIQYGQIIADHTVVDKFDDIPQYYLDKVKEMWVVVAGESHSQAYRDGMILLETTHPIFQVNVKESGTPEGYTNQHLRISRATWGDVSNSSGWIYSYGEEDWFTNATAINRTKAGITYCNTHSLPIAAIGFGWCWDMVGGWVSGGTDPVYGCHWYGYSKGGPENKIDDGSGREWGLDDADYSITGNSISMDTYLSVTQQYIDYCKSNGNSTTVFFTTGPVDDSYTNGEAGYQGHIKHEYIRDYVKADPTRILFDYADILCYDDNGELTTATWNGNTFPRITPTNLGSANIGHIGSAGATRLAKAMWWMLARIAGWDGVATEIEDIESNNGEIWTEVRDDGLTVHLPENMLLNKADLYSIDGSLKTSKRSNSDLISLNISNLSPGLYILVIQHDSGTASKKIILP